jgi:hypothetical protein
MALQLDTRYPGRFDTATSEYPQGAFKNRSAPAALDGSYLEKDWANDKQGFFSSLMAAAGGLAANELVDEVGASQHYDQLLAVIQELIDATPGFESGDYLASADEAAMLARGFTFAGIDPLVPGVVDNFGDWSEQTSPVSVASVWGISVNSITKDQIVCSNSTDDVYRSAGGTAAFIAFGSFPATIESGADTALDETTSDVWTWGLDSFHRVYKSAGGTSNFVDTGNYIFGGIADIAVNKNGGHVWVGRQVGEVYKLTDGVGSFAEFGVYPGGTISAITVNYNTDDVFIASSIAVYKLVAGALPYVLQSETLPGLITSMEINSDNGTLVIGTNAGVYKLEEGGSYVQLGTYPSNSSGPSSIAIDDVLFDIYTADNAAPGDAIFISAHGFSVDPVDWYVKT